MNDFLKDYLKELDTNTANAMSTELIPNRELAFTHYILTQIAAKVGELIAKNAQEAGVQTVVFDRNGYLYHGRIKELADAARNGGLKF